MKAIVLTSRHPYPPFSGDRLRISKIVEALRIDFDVEVLVVENALLKRLKDHGLDELPAPVPVQRYTIGIFASMLGVCAGLFDKLPMQAGLFNSRSARRWVAERAATADLVVVHLARLFPLVRGSDMPSICEMTDLLSINYQRALSVAGGCLRRAALQYEMAAMMRLESQVRQHCRSTVLVTLADGAGGNDEGLVEIPMGCTEVNPIAMPHGSRVILFIGKADYAPNMDAITFFAMEVLPILGKEFTLRVVGHANEEALTAIRRLPGVEATGAVQSLSDAAAGCICAVAPMRFGSGMQTKVLDYAVMGIPSIVSAGAANGYKGAFADALHIEANAAERLAGAVTNLCENAPLYWHRALQVRELALAEYSWRAQQERYAKLASAAVALGQAQVDPSTTKTSTRDSCELE